MSFVSIVNSELYWPVRVPLATSKAVSGTTAAETVFVSALTMNDANDDAHIVGNLRWADGGTGKTITRVYFVPTNLSAPTGTLRVGLQTVATGVQAKRGDGTFDRYGTLAAVSLVADAVNYATLDTGTATYSDGDLVSVAFDWSAYVSGSFDFRTFTKVATTAQFPCCTLNTAQAGGLPNILLYASDGTYGTIQGGGWGLTASHVSFNLAASPNEVANRFTCPIRMRVNGIWLKRSTSTNLGMNFYVGIYDDVGAVVVERLIGSSENAGSSGEYKLDTYAIPETTLEVGETYHVSCRAADTNTVGVEFIATGNAAFGAPFPGGVDCVPRQRSAGSGSFFTYSGTGQFTMGVTIAAVDDGVGSGWIPGSGTSGNTLKVLFDPAALGATTISGAVFAAPSGTDVVGPKIGEFTGEAVEADLEDGKAVLKVAVSAFGGTGLLVTDNPVVLLRNAEYTTGYINATVINE